MRNLVYVIGLPRDITTCAALQSYHVFGKFGKVKKVILSSEKPFGNKNHIGRSCSAYVTFESEIEATMAILAVDGIKMGKRYFRASFGMTKFCSFFLNGQKCPKEQCLFLHRSAKEGDVVTVKDKVSQKVHIKMSRENVFDYCLSLGAEEIVKYEQNIIKVEKEREQLVDINQENKSEINEFPKWRNIIEEVGYTLKLVKANFRKKFNKTIYLTQKSELSSKMSLTKGKSRKSQAQRKKKRNKKKRVQSRKSTIGKW